MGIVVQEGSERSNELTHMMRDFKVTLTAGWIVTADDADRAKETALELAKMASSYDFDYKVTDLGEAQMHEWMVDLGSHIIEARTAEDAKAELLMDIGTGDTQPQVTNVERVDVDGV